MANILLVRYAVWSLYTVTFPILGNDFLAAHHLHLDPAQPATIHRPSGRFLPLSPPASPSVLSSPLQSSR